MPSNRLVVALAAVALAGVVGPAASARAGGNGNGGPHQQAGPTPYGDTNDIASCLPGATTCTATARPAHQPARCGRTRQ